MEPASPLPWKIVTEGNHQHIKDALGLSIPSLPFNRLITMNKDRAYIVHACNAYPALVEAVVASRAYDLALQFCNHNQVIGDSFCDSHGNSLSDLHTAWRDATRAALAASGEVVEVV